MYRALPSLRAFSAAIVLVATSFAVAPFVWSQTEDPPPPVPGIGGGSGSDCSDPSLSHPECYKWRKETEAWRERQRAKQTAKPSVEKARSDTELPVIRVEAPKEVDVGSGSFRLTGLVGDNGSPPRLTVDGERQPLFKPRPGDSEIAEHTLAFDVSIAAERPGDRPVILEACDAAGNCVAERVVVRVVAGKPVKKDEAIAAKAGAEPAIPTAQEIARLEAEVARLGAQPVRGGAGGVDYICTGGDSDFAGYKASKTCVEYLQAREQLRKARAAREQLLAEGQVPPAPRTPTVEEQAAAQRLAEERRREGERTAAAEREAEKLRKELEEVRRQSARAEAERKAAEEDRRLAEERARQEAERLKQQAVAARKAAVEARRAAEERARQEAEAEQQAAAEPATTQDQRTQEQLAAIQKQLEALARQRPALDTDLPLIRATVPERVEVGDAKRITGLVGDEGSPPRLKVNGEPVLLFRLRAGQKPIAKHTLAFDIAVDAAAVGGRRYALEACDAAANCIGEMIALEVVAANRPNVRAKNYALLIGNNDHQQLPDLKTAIADATAVAEVLASRYAFERENVRLLLNADRKSIMGELSALRRRLRNEDRLFIYYAGHGEIEPSTEEGFWQPVDAVPGEDYTWIANSDIRRYLRGMSAKHVLVVADSCFSGSLTRGEGGWRNVPKDRFFTEIDSYVSRTVISSGGTEPVADAGSGGHSVFAYYLLKALRDNDQPYVTSFELFNKLARAVTNNSNQKPEYGTVAGAGDEGSGDFTFILR